MKIIKLVNVVVQIHVRDEYSKPSIIVMVNALIKIAIVIMPAILC